eukprot:94286_1
MYSLLSKLPEGQHWIPSALVGCGYYLLHNNPTNTLSIVTLGAIGSGLKGGLMLRNEEDGICQYHAKANGFVVCSSSTICGALGVILMGFVNVIRNNRYHKQSWPVDTCFELWCLTGTIISTITIMYADKPATATYM